MKIISPMKSILVTVFLTVFSLASFVVNVHTDIGKVGIDTSYTISLVGNTYATCLDARDPGCVTAAGNQSSTVGTSGGGGGGATAAGGGSGAKESEWLKNAVDALNAILGFLTFLITPLIALAGWLMSPDWTRGDLFGLNQGLYKIWITVSNITYFLYALGLIGIALATIFSVENYTYKQLLPKLALGILIVPFTWWMVQAVLSVGNILTVAVMQIPRDTLEALSGPSTSDTWYRRKSIPQEVTYDNTSNKKKADITTSAPNGCIDASGNETPEAKQGKCLSPEQLLTNASSGPYSMLTIYAYSVFKIQDFKNITNVTTGISEILQVFHKLLYGGLVYLIFGLLVIALVIALLARAFELWILTMFSPLLSLSIVLPDSIKGESFKDHISFKNLVALAMVPVIVAGSLSFGVLFLGVLMNGGKNPTSAADTGGCGENTICLFGSKGASTDVNVSFLKISSSTNLSSTADRGDIGVDAGATTSFITSTFKLGAFSLIHKGTIDNESATTIANGTNFFNGAGGIIGKVILDVIALALLWMTLMGALKISKIMGSAIDPIANAGKSLADLAKKGPQYIPIPGIGSLKGAESLAANFKGSFDTNAINKAQESALGKVIHANKLASGETKTAMAKVISSIDGNESNEVVGQKLREFMSYARTDNGKGKETKEEMLNVLNKLNSIESETKRNDIIDKGGFTDPEKLKAAFRDMDRKNPIRKEDTQKLDQLFSYMGKGSGPSNSSTSSSQSTFKSTKNDINKDGTINFNALISGDISVNMKQSADKKSTAIDSAELEELKKIKENLPYTLQETIDKIRNNLKQAGMETSAATDAAKKIAEALDAAGKLKKSGGTKSADAGTASGANPAA